MEATPGLQNYFQFYNHQRFHQPLAYGTPAQAYFAGQKKQQGITVFYQPSPILISWGFGLDKGSTLIGRVYQQAFVGTYSKVAHAKLYQAKTPITVAGFPNGRVLPSYGERGLPMLRILIGRGTGYCGKAGQHGYRLYLALNGIGHTKTKAKPPQTNGICGRFHKTVLNGFYPVALRKKVYTSVGELQAGLDGWPIKYNTQRTHQGKMCCRRTPMETLIGGKQTCKEKFMN